MSEIRKEIGWDDGTGQAFEVASESPGPSAFSVTSPENLSFSERERSFIVRTTNRQPAASAVVKVRQEAPAFSYLLVLYVMDASDIGPEGGSREIYALLKTYRNGVEVSSEDVVPSLSVEGLGFYCRRNLVYALNRNNDNGDRRSCSVEGSYEVPGYGTVTGNFIIYQGSNYREDAEFISLSIILSSSSYTVDAKGGYVNVRSYISSVLCRLRYPSGYEASENVMGDSEIILSNDLPSWLSWWSSSGSIIGVYASANTGDSRSASINVNASYQGLTDLKVFTVTQQEGVVHNLTASPSILTFPAEGGTLTFAISSDESWTIS